MKGFENLTLDFGAAGHFCYYSRATGRRQFADRAWNNEGCTASITTVMHKVWKGNLRAGRGQPKCLIATVLAAIASLFLLTVSVRFQEVRLPHLSNPSSTLFIE